MNTRRKLLLALATATVCGLLLRGWRSDAKEVVHSYEETPAPAAGVGSPGQRDVVQRPARNAALAELLRLKIAEAKEDAREPAHLNEDKLARTDEEHAAAGMTMLGLYCSGHSSAWNTLAINLRKSEPALSQQITELARELAVAARAYADVDLPALQAKERALLQRLRSLPDRPERFRRHLERMAQHVEAMARGQGPSVAAKLEREAEQPIRFERRPDDDVGKGEPDDE